MDSITKYQNIIVEYLEEFIDKRPANMPDIDRYAIVDRNSNNFQLLDMGWQGNNYVFTVVFHFRIHNGKVWLQCNITERETVDVLMERGVPKEDIVLGFRHPKVRAQSGFAIA